MKNFVIIILDYMPTEKKFLNKFVNMQKTENEINRSLEQMRFLDHDIDIFVGYTDDNPLSVDTKEDLEKLENIYETKNCHPR